MGLNIFKLVFLPQKELINDLAEGRKLKWFG